MTNARAFHTFATHRSLKFGGNFHMCDARQAMTHPFSRVAETIISLMNAPAPLKRSNSASKFKRTVSDEFILPQCRIIHSRLGLAIDLAVI